MIDVIQKYVKPGSTVKLVAQLEALIRSGKVAPEALLPPVRETARVLKVSPGTVAATYKALRARGVVTTDRRRGTRVLPRPDQREYAEPPAARGAVDLQVANPDPSLLPDLRKIFAEVAEKGDSYGGDHVDHGLAKWARAALAADGIPSAHFIVTAGAIPAIHSALHACLKPGDKVAVEDPGFNDHRSSVGARGMLAVPVSVDDEGMKPTSLAAALREGACAVLLSPRCQSPTGAAMKPARAAEVRAVLSAFPQVMVIVDDYGSLITDWPYRDCIGKDRARWLVARSLNKALGPDLRVGFAVGDAETVDRMRREQWLGEGWVSGYLQRAAGAALLSRSGQALLVRARATYSARREALMAALERRGIRAQGMTGLNVWVPVSDEAVVVQGMLARGWSIRSGARYRIRSAAAIRITTTHLLPTLAERVAEDLLAVIRHPVGRTP